jgi:hypothetical protein
MRDAHAPDRFGLGRAEFTQSWITGLTREAERVNN